VVYLDDETFSIERAEGSPIFSLESEVINAGSRGCENALDG